MKKIFPIFLLAILVLCTLTSCGDEYYYTENFTYVIENGGLTLTSCNITSSEEIIIPEVEENGKKVLRIDPMTFSNYVHESQYNKLKTIVVPDSVTYIGVSAFEYCEALTSITLSNKLTTMTSQLFLHCTSLSSVRIPSSVKIIEDYVFRKCYNLENVIIPTSVTKINSSAFKIGITEKPGVFKHAYYEGSMEEFNKISIESYNNEELLNNVYYYSETKIEGNYWHYVDNVATVW